MTPHYTFEPWISRQHTRPSRIQFHWTRVGQHPTNVPLLGDIDFEFSEWEDAAEMFWQTVEDRADEFIWLLSQANQFTVVPHYWRGHDVVAVGYGHPTGPIEIDYVIFDFSLAFDNDRDAVLYKLFWL